jgi:hypothetical protein
MRQVRLKTYMILSLQVFGAKMTTAKYMFSTCANGGHVPILDITAPYTHGDLSWPITERGSIEMTLSVIML